MARADVLSVWCVALLCACALSLWAFSDEGHCVVRGTPPVSKHHRHAEDRLEAAGQAQAQAEEQQQKKNSQQQQQRQQQQQQQSGQPGQQRQDGAGQREEALGFFSREENAFRPLFYQHRLGGRGKHNGNVTHMPDVYALAALQAHRGGVLLSRDGENHRWLLGKPPKALLFMTDPPVGSSGSRGGAAGGGSEAREIFFTSTPPRTGWLTYPSRKTTPIDVQCEGPTYGMSLSLTKGLDPAGNVGTLLRRPVTTVLLIINLAVAYHLWAKKVPVEDVAFSYNWVWAERRDYWRIVTASFSHFDLLHIGFNMISLYNIGSVEEIYGPIPYLYLTLDLVFLTIILCLGMYHYMIHQQGNTAMATQPAIGYSCVLFGWMVVATVRRSNYCPLPFFPSLCFDTWQIPLPGVTGFTLPVNVAPFILLFFTKLIMPRSSFIGHLSGIVLGFPIAWGALTWLTPPLLCTCLGTLLLYLEHAFPWQLPRREMEPTAPFHEFVPAHYRWYAQGVRIMAIGHAALAVAAAHFFGTTSTPTLSCIAAALFCWMAFKARRIAWLATTRDVRDHCSISILTAVAILATAAISAWLSVWAALASKAYLYGGFLPPHRYWLGVLGHSVLFLVHLGALALLLLVSADLEATQHALRPFKLDAAAIDGAREVWQRYFRRMRQNEQTRFEGTGRTLRGVASGAGAAAAAAAGVSVGAGPAAGAGSAASAVATSSAPGAIVSEADEGLELPTKNPAVGTGSAAMMDNVPLVRNDPDAKTKASKAAAANEVLHEV